MSSVMLVLDCVPPTVRFHCLPLYVYPKSLTMTWHLCCLLLCPTGERKGQFRRDGYLHVNGGAFRMDNWTSFGKVKNEAWLEYVAVDESGQYLISII